MDRYVVAGNPVEHSQSPFIHTEFARQTGEPIEYGRLLCPLADFGGALRALADAGAKGCNVTVPFKLQAFALAPRHSPRCEWAQAANTLRFDARGWIADNTDGVGLVRDIEHNAGVSLAGRRVLLVGAGGAAAGVLGPLLEAGPAEIAVANRTVEKARALVERHREAAAAATARVALHACALGQCDERYDVVVNASASSLEGAPIPIDARVLAPGALALDLMYGPAARRFVDWAGAHGARGRDGLGMLVEQAAAAFEFWRGVRPDTTPVLAALRARLTAPPAP
ncbi:MAG TPA: shikimate dehydrogenase [Burkholderiaceae bacterium]|nr:shikimate dehydrogenase [Burkholderiaceae bacterium]